MEQITTTSKEWAVAAIMEFSSQISTGLVLSENSVWKAESVGSCGNKVGGTERASTPLLKAVISIHASGPMKTRASSTMTTQNKGLVRFSRPRRPLVALRVVPVVPDTGAGPADPPGVAVGWVEVVTSSPASGRS